jgi:hypothetical protein
MRVKSSLRLQLTKEEARPHEAGTGITNREVCEYGVRSKRYRHEHVMVEEAYAFLVNRDVVICPN